MQKEVHLLVVRNDMYVSAQKNSFPGNLWMCFPFLLEGFDIIPSKCGWNTTPEILFDICKFN